MPKTIFVIDDEEPIRRIVRSYLEKEGYRKDTIAIECNEEILPKSRYEEKILRDGDVLEIVNFVGGG